MSVTDICYYSFCCWWFHGILSIRLVIGQLLNEFWLAIRHFEYIMIIMLLKCTSWNTIIRHIWIQHIWYYFRQLNYLLLVIRLGLRRDSEKWIIIFIQISWVWCNDIRFKSLYINNPNCRSNHKTYIICNNYT